MGYVIVQDARKGESYGIQQLFLVDRKKSKRLWWTSDNPSIVLVYEKKEAADFAASRLRMNNARVISDNMAFANLDSQQNAIQQAEDEMDYSWEPIQ